MRRGVRAVAALLLCAVAPLLPYAVAMHADQAGTFDWHRAHLGAVSHAAVLARSRLYVGSATTGACRGMSVLWHRA